MLLLHLYIYSKCHINLIHTNKWYMFHILAYPSVAPIKYVFHPKINIYFLYDIPHVLFIRTFICMQTLEKNFNDSLCIHRIRGPKQATMQKNQIYNKQKLQTENVRSRAESYPTELLIRAAAASACRRRRRRSTRRTTCFFFVSLKNVHSLCVFGFSPCASCSHGL